MSVLINTLLIISAIVMIILIVLQPGKSEGLSGAISGGAEQLFGKKKARGVTGQAVVLDGGYTAQ